MRERTLRRSKGWAVLAIVLVLAGCTQTRQFTFSPIASAHIVEQQFRENFGVCVGDDSRQADFETWEILVQQKASAEGRENFGVSGYEAQILRGESCNLRVAEAFQTAYLFELSPLPEEGVVSQATLLLDWDQPTDCGFHRVEQVGEPWDPGIYSTAARAAADSLPPPDGERGFLSTRSAGPNTRLRDLSRVNVTRAVLDWQSGARPNHGLAITQDFNSVLERFRQTNPFNPLGWSCWAWIYDAELEVTFQSRE